MPPKTRASVPKKTPAPREPFRPKKKKMAEPQPVVVPAAAAGSSNADLSGQMAQIIQLLQGQQRVPQPAPALQPPVVHVPPVAPPPPALVQQDNFTAAMAALDARMPTAQGNIDIVQFLSRRAQRIVREGSIDMISLADFIYAYIGYLLESTEVTAELEEKLSFVRQVAEDSSQYRWAGVLDWAMTIIDRINSNNITWASTQEIAMDRPVISRSVANAARPIAVPCPDFNQFECPEKANHTEGRFKLLHVCGFCFLVGAEHAHTERACHKKKAYVSGRQKQASSQSAAAGKPRHSKYDGNREKHEGKN